MSPMSDRGSPRSRGIAPALVLVVLMWVTAFVIFQAGGDSTVTKILANVINLASVVVLIAAVRSYRGSRDPK